MTISFSRLGEAQTPRCSGLGSFLPPFVTGGSSSQPVSDAPPVITWNTEPDTSYDGRKIKWTCSDWLRWHQELVKKGRERKWSMATINNNIFMPWWDRKKSLFDSQDFCGYNSDWYYYFKGVGLTDVLSYFQAVITPIASTGANVLDKATETVENIVEAASNTSGVLKWLIPTAVVVGVTGLGYYGYITYLKTKKRKNG